MNREEKRILKKKMGKHLVEIGDEIVELHNKYDGKDDKKLEGLVADRIKLLSFEQLLLLTEYLDNCIAPKS